MNLIKSRYVIKVTRLFACNCSCLCCQSQCLSCFSLKQNKINLIRSLCVNEVTRFELYFFNLGFCSLLSCFSQQQKTRWWNRVTLGEMLLLPKGCKTRKNEIYLCWWPSNRHQTMHYFSSLLFVVRSNCKVLVSTQKNLSHTNLTIRGVPELVVCKLQS